MPPSTFCRGTNKSLGVPLFPKKEKGPAVLHADKYGSNDNLQVAHRPLRNVLATRRLARRSAAMFTLMTVLRAGLFVCRSLCAFTWWPLNPRSSEKDLLPVGVDLSLTWIVNTGPHPGFVVAVMHGALIAVLPGWLTQADAWLNNVGKVMMDYWGVWEFHPSCFVTASVCHWSFGLWLRLQFYGCLNLSPLHRLNGFMYSTNSNHKKKVFFITYKSPKDSAQYTLTIMALIKQLSRDGYEISIL